MLYILAEPNQRLPVDLGECMRLIRRAYYKLDGSLE